VGETLRIFLDIGANKGQVLWVALQEKYKFDRIHCFEPVECLCDVLQNFKDDRVTIHPFGLSNSTGKLTLYNPGRVCGSIYPRHGVSNIEQICNFIKARDWFRSNLDMSDQNIMKLNCEGSECDILDDLIESGEINKIDTVMVDFDIRKIRSQKYREKELRLKLKNLKNTNVLFCEEVAIGKTHIERTQNWLNIAGVS